MTLKQTLQTDLTAAMRSGDEVRRSTLRLALAAVTTEEVAGKSARELSDAEVLAVLTREGKKRRESATAYEAGNRPDLVARELAELAVLAEYLPTALTEDELATIIDAAVTDVGSAGVTGPAALGQVMKVVTPQVQGRAEGAHVAALVRQRLAG